MEIGHLKEIILKIACLLCTEFQVLDCKETLGQNQHFLNSKGLICKRVLVQVHFLVDLKL